MGKRYDYILVLGYPNRIAAQRQIVNSRLSAAIGLYKKGAAGKIIAVGGGINIRPAGKMEADVIKRYLVRHGVPPAEVITERRSKNTIGNAFFTRPLVKRNSSMVIVTSEFHIPRARYAFSKFFDKGYRIRFYASKTDRCLLPKARAFEKESFKHVRSVLKGIDPRSTDSQVMKVLRGIRKSPLTPAMKRKAWY